MPTDEPDSEIDDDGDDYIECSSFVTIHARAPLVGGDDCDDTRAYIHPNHNEDCDGWDNNCSAGGTSFPTDDAGIDEDDTDGDHYLACVGWTPNSEPTLVGDVLISPQVAASQADGHAGDYEAECRLLVVHGSLHLTGWDHADDSSRESMWGRERELLAGFDMLPPRDPWAPQ